MEFRSEGVESKEVSELPLEEVEVLEWPSERVSGEGSEWKEHVVVLGTARRGFVRGQPVFRSEAVLEFCQL